MQSPDASQCDADAVPIHYINARLPSISRASRTAGPPGWPGSAAGFRAAPCPRVRIGMEPPGRPGSAAGFHGARSKGDVAAAPPLIDAMSPVRRLAAPAALPDAAEASGASQGAASRGSVFGSRTQGETSRNSHRRLCGPPANLMAAIPLPGRASARRPKWSARCHRRGGRPAEAGPRAPRTPCQGIARRVKLHAAVRRRHKRGVGKLAGRDAGQVAPRASAGPAPAAGAVQGRAGRPVLRRTPPPSCRRIFAAPLSLGAVQGGPEATASLRELCRTI